MAVSLQESVTIARPPEAVFEYLKNVENDPKWQKSVVEAKQTSPGDPGLGTTGIHRVKFMGMTDDYGWEITDFEEAKRGGWTFTSGPLTGRAGYVLDAVEGGTRVTFSGEVQPKGLRRFLAPLMRPAWAKETRRDLENLKRVLESRA